jgi:transposase-like protein
VSDSREKYSSKLVRPYKRRSDELDTTFQKLFIEGLATRDFEPALRALTGTEAPLSPSSISRLNKQFKDDYEAWTERDLSDLKIAYIWVDGVSIAAGIADERAHLLVIIGVDMTGTKRLLALKEGYRESKESWTEVLRDLKKRGLNQPALAVADGALGFWAALPEVWPLTKKQQCWFHKTQNILDKLPKDEQKEGVERLRGIQKATGREAALRLAKKLIAEWRQAGYDRAAKCLESALERLLTFFDFPPEHAKHLRTTNPVESPFATMRIRTNAARRFRTSKSGLHLVFKLFERIEKRWLKITSPEKLKNVKLPA